MRLERRPVPEAVGDCLQFVAEFTETRVMSVATGPGRVETIILPRSIGRGGAVSRPTGRVKVIEKQRDAGGARAVCEAGVERVPAGSQTGHTIPSAGSAIVLIDWRCVPPAKDKEDVMTRKVSIWIVVALVGALTATTAAVVALATHDRIEGRAERGLPSADGWPHGWPDAQGDRHLPVMGDMRGGWDGGRESPVLPWVLFAVSTGTAVGLLVAWRPWRTAPASSGGADGVVGGKGGAVLPAQTVTLTSEEPSAGAADLLATDEVVEAQVTEEAGEASPES